MFKGKLAITQRINLLINFTQIDIRRVVGLAEQEYVKKWKLKKR